MRMKDGSRRASWRCVSAKGRRGDYQQPGAIPPVVLPPSRAVPCTHHTAGLPCALICPPLEVEAKGTECAFMTGHSYHSDMKGCTITARRERGRGGGGEGEERKKGGFTGGIEVRKGGLEQPAAS